MTRINLTKYGFVRNSAEDFSDDGTRFQVYSLDGMRVSKAISDGYLYLAARYEGINQVLEYKEYSKLPHYNALDALNGISLSVVTEQAISDFADACKSYCNEYIAAANSAHIPSYNELWAARFDVLKTRQLELETISEKLKADPLVWGRLSSCETTRLADGLKQLMEDADEITFRRRLKNVLGTNYSRYLVDLDAIRLDCRPSRAYQKCLQILG